jgi:hypothetical protein
VSSRLFAAGGGGVMSSSLSLMTFPGANFILSFNASRELVLSNSIEYR